MMNNTKDVLLSMLPLLLYYTFSQFDTKYKAWKLNLSLSKTANNRRVKKRIKWSTVGERISDKQFRRMFRMTRQRFLNYIHILQDQLERRSSNLNPTLMHS